MTADITAIPDDRLLFYYNSVRKEIEADRHAKYPVAGSSARAYADALDAELKRRGVSHQPIVS